MLERWAFRAFAVLVNTPGLYLFAKEAGRMLDPLRKLVQGTVLDPVKPWTATRDLPPVAEESFKEWWRNRR